MNREQAHKILAQINEDCMTETKPADLLAWLENESANGIRYDNPTRFAEAMSDHFGWHLNEDFEYPESVDELAEALLEVDDEPGDPDDQFEIQMQRDDFDYGRVTY